MNKSQQPAQPTVPKMPPKARLSGGEQPDTLSTADEAALDKAWANVKPPKASPKPQAKRSK